MKTARRPRAWATSCPCCATASPTSRRRPRRSQGRGRRGSGRTRSISAECKAFPSTTCARTCATSTNAWTRTAPRPPRATASTSTPRSSPASIRRPRSTRPWPPSTPRTTTSRARSAWPRPPPTRRSCNRGARWRSRPLNAQAEVEPLVALAEQLRELRRQRRPRAHRRLRAQRQARPVSEARHLCSARRYGRGEVMDSLLDRLFKTLLVHLRRVLLPDAGSRWASRACSACTWSCTSAQCVVFELFGKVRPTISEPGLHCPWMTWARSPCWCRCSASKLIVRPAPRSNLPAQPAREFRGRRTHGHRRLVRDVRERSASTICTRTRDPRRLVARQRLERRRCAACPT